jgi:ribosome-associated protein
VVRVVAADTRSQARNRELALARLRERLADALRTPRARQATAPTAGARRRRIEAKRRRGDLKRQRQMRPGPED